MQHEICGTKIPLHLTHNHIFNPKANPADNQKTYPSPAARSISAVKCIIPEPPLRSPFQVLLLENGNGNDVKLR